MQRKHETSDRSSFHNKHTYGKDNRNGLIDISETTVHTGQTRKWRNGTYTGTEKIFKKGRIMA